MTSSGPLSKEVSRQHLITPDIRGLRGQSARGRTLLVVNKTLGMTWARLYPCQGVRLKTLNGLMKCLSVATWSDSGCFSRIIALITLPLPLRA